MFAVVGDVEPSDRQRSEQYRTSSQSRAHFLRHANGRPQATQIFVGRSAFRRIFAMLSVRARVIVKA